jgi:chorismate mutase
MKNIISVSSDRQALLKLFNFGKETTADINKKLLLEMAENGKDKPHYKSKLGKALSCYTLKCSRSYDDVFTKKIKKLRPDWFLSLTSKYKIELIKIAKNKKSKKPRTTCKLGNALRNYLYKDSKTYDHSFYKKIKFLRPDWVVNETVENKKLLLRMAKNKKEKPNWASCKLGRVLRSYTRPRSGCFDDFFFNKIKKIAPHWFVSSIDRNKKELLKLAKNKKSKRPGVDCASGRALRRYQYTAHYKSNKATVKFVKQIKKLRPDWFRK